LNVHLQQKTLAGNKQTMKGMGYWVWKTQKNSQINHDDICLPFFLLFLLWLEDLVAEESKEGGGGGVGG